MFYKEWLSVRPKFQMWLAFYGMAGLFYSFYSLFDYISKYSPVNPSIWATIFGVLTLFNSFLGGFDVISEEKDKQTISFLLSRPVTRTQIYNAKLFTNIAALWLAGGMGSFIPFVTIISNLRYQIDTGSALSSLFAMVFVLVIGSAITCLTALISIYTHNGTQTLLYSPIISILMCIIADQIYLILFSGGSMSFVASLGFVGCCTVILYYAGLLSFRRKDF